MKLVKRMTMALLLIMLIGTLAGCSGLLGWILPLSIEDRIAAFTLAINDSDRDPDTILLNFGPKKDMDYYDAAKKETFWDDAFPAEYTYLFTLADNSALEAGTVDGYLTIKFDGMKITSSGGELLVNYSFTMYEEASGNWLISAIYEEVDGTDEFLIKKVEF